MLGASRCFQQLLPLQAQDKLSYMKQNISSFFMSLKFLHLFYTLCVCVCVNEWVYVLCIHVCV